MGSEHPTNLPTPLRVARPTDAECDAEYFELASRALLGNEEARAELRYRFPWRNPPDNPAWDQIPSSEVRRLVALTLSISGDAITANLKLHLEVQSAFRAASQWALHQNQARLTTKEAR